LHGKFLNKQRNLMVKMTVSSGLE